jgi:hypothetical protein
MQTSHTPFLIDAFIVSPSYAVPLLQHKDVRIFAVPSFQRGKDDTVALSHRRTCHLFLLFARSITSFLDLLLDQRAPNLCRTVREMI